MKTGHVPADQAHMAAKMLAAAIVVHLEVMANKGAPVAFPVMVGVPGLSAQLGTPAGRVGFELVGANSNSQGWLLERTVGLTRRYTEVHGYLAQHNRLSHVEVA